MYLINLQYLAIIFSYFINAFKGMDRKHPSPLGEQYNPSLTNDAF